CGTTHVFNIITIWNPIYWTDGAVKLITALASVPTAILLWKLIPKALTLPTPGELQKTNKKLEKEVEERAQAEKQILRLNAILNEQIAKLTFTNQELDSFTYSVSHDLRAPLRHIAGFVELLQENPALHQDPEASRNIKVVQESATRMG